MSNQGLKWHAGHFPETSRAALAAAGAALAIALLASIGWLSGFRLLAGAWQGYVPVSPATSAGLLLLSGALFGELRWAWSRRGAGRWLVPAAAGIPGLLALLVLIQFASGAEFGIERMLSRTDEFLGKFPLGRMSPFTAAALLLESAALLLLLRRAAAWPAGLGFVGACGGLVVVVGYLYGAPLFYDGSIIPVALPTGMAVCLMGMAETALALRRTAWLPAWTGDSSRGILLRAFLPATVALLLLEGWLSAHLGNRLHPALAHTLTVIAGCGVMAALTAWTARRVGDALDTAADAVRSSEELFRRVFEHSAAGMAIVAPDARFLQVNEALCRMLGYRAEELLGLSFHAVTMPEDWSVSEDQIRRALAGEVEMFHVEKRYQRKDGTVARALVVSTLVRDEHRQPLFFVAQIQDLTEREQAAAALRESRELLRAVLDSIPVRVFWKDRNSVYLGCNRAFAQDAGFEKPEELIGKDDFASVWRDQAEHYRADDRSVIESAAAKLLYEEIQTTPSGERIHLLTSKVPLRDDTGAIVGVLGTYHDITQRHRVENALRDSEETHRALVAGLPDMVMRYDREGRHLFVSENVREAAGMEASRFLGKTHRELGFPEPLCRIWEQAIRDVFETGQPRETEFTLDGPHGPAIYNWRLVPEHTPGGETRTVLSISRNITAYRRAEEELRRSEERLRSTLDAAGVVAWEINFAEGTHHEAGPVDRLFGRPPGFHHESVEALLTSIHSDDRDRVARTMEEARLGARPYKLEFRVPQENGEIRWIATEGTIQRDSSGTAIRLLGVAVDITERKRAEEELRASEQRSAMLARALQSTGECVSITDLGNNLLYVNEAFCHTYGYREEDLIGRHISIVWSEQTPPDVFGAILPASRAGGWQGELWNRTRDGREFPIALTTSTIYDEQGRPAALVGIARDITERRRAEERNVMLQAQLHQSQKMESIGRLAGGVAHDFNNLLTVINGYSQMLLSRLPQGDSTREILEAVHSAGERAASLTRQLLAFSRKQVLEPRKIDVNRLLTEMQPLLGRLVGEDIHVDVRVGRHEGMVLADPHQLEQVVMNLVVNARDAMPDGGRLTISAGSVEVDRQFSEAHPELKPGPYVLLTVTDTGCGMDEETRKHAFEPFFTTKAVGKGTGLGLSMVQGVVAQSGGCVEIVSQPDHGTSFRIFLPAAVEAPEVTGSEVRTPARGGDETVLIVEDQEGVRKYAMTVLKSYGYRVISEASAAEALRRCGQEHIHLLLTDVVMPEVSGRELADRLTARQPGIKVLFMSGYTDNVIAHHGVLEEGENFIQKPFLPEELARKVRTVLGPAVSAPPPCILVADDEAGVRGFLATVLRKQGYTVLEAANGDEALSRIQTGEVDLLVTDLVMPDHEGLDLIQVLRRYAPGLGIIAVSGAFEGQFLEVARLLGADGILPKPILPETLAAKVKEVLQKRQQDPDARLG